MPMYALTTVPLINSLNASANQVWYSEDAAATGKIANLRTWWDGIVTHGPGYGYHANASKTWLVVKEKFKPQAEAAFADTAVRITCERWPHLGAPLGTADYIEKFVSEKILQWSQELTLLYAITVTQPHAAFAAYTHGMYSKWSNLTRTVPEIGQQLE